jgi:hypothetical protein
MTSYRRGRNPVPITHFEMAVEINTSRQHSITKLKNMARPEVIDAFVSYEEVRPLAKSLLDLAA